MALDFSTEALSRRIDALRGGFSGYQNTLRDRNQVLLRAFSPEYSPKLGEFDQWDEPIVSENVDHDRSSYNLTRSVCEMWAALEAEELPAIRWSEGFLPSPIPSMDPNENSRRNEFYRAQRLTRQHVATMREQAVLYHFRRAQAEYHLYRATLRKNVYGHSWIKVYPEIDRRRFCIISRIDPSTVYPIWSVTDGTRLDAVLVAYRRSAQSIDAEFPGALTLERDGITVMGSDYYTGSNTSTATSTSQAQRAFVWVEDYWVIDGKYREDTDEGPVDGMVVNVLRVNGKVIEGSRVEYPGWRRLPYFLHENENERDQFGFSDAATMLPIQGSLNKLMSQQQDVIRGASRPKFKYRGDSGRTISIDDEGVIALDQDEDVEQLQVRMDIYPTDRHSAQLMELMARATGLNDTVWGRIAANSNSGRALSTAWRSVAARLVPRVLRNSRSLREETEFMIDLLELYDWDDARALFNGNRDFEFQWPNKEPRDFLEVTQDALAKLSAGITTSVMAMEATGDESPDQTDEDVRAEFTDTVRHPDKAQSYLLLQNMEQKMAIEAQQAQLAMQSAQVQLSQLANTPPGGAPSGASGSIGAQAAAATQARTQAAQQAAPSGPPGRPGAGAAAQQAGAAAGNTVASTLVQDGGAAQNRIIAKVPIA